MSVLYDLWILIAREGNVKIRQYWEGEEDEKDTRETMGEDDG